MEKHGTIDKEFSPNFPTYKDSKQNGSSLSESSNIDDGEGQFIDGEYVKTHGMSWIVTAVFLVGEAGGGFYTGLVLCVIMAVVATASAIFLGKSWEIMLRRWTEYRRHCRKPYAEMGYRALGSKAKTLVSICLNLTQFGVCVVYILLSAKNIHDFIGTYTPNGLDLCLVIIVVGVILLPLTFLKSPEDF